MQLTCIHCLTTHTSVWFTGFRAQPVGHCYTLMVSSYYYYYDLFYFYLFFNFFYYYYYYCITVWNRMLPSVYFGVNGVLQKSSSRGDYLSYTLTSSAYSVHCTHIQSLVKIFPVATPTTPMTSIWLRPYYALTRL